jgi:hypothetical protein
LGPWYQAFPEAFERLEHADADENESALNTEAAPVLPRRSDNASLGQFQGTKSTT